MTLPRCAAMISQPCGFATLGDPPRGADGGPEPPTMVQPMETEGVMRGDGPRRVRSRAEATLRLLLAQHPRALAAAGVGLCLLIFFAAAFGGSDDETIGVMTKGAAIEYKGSLDLSAFKKCVGAAIEPPVQDDGQDLRPFWFSQYPDSVPEDIITSIVVALTGLSAKSYYARNRRYKCQGGVQTVACMQNHPMDDADPEGQTALFNPEVVYAIRNPTTLFAAHQSAKAGRFGTHSGQITEEEWRHFRDLYAMRMFDGYKRQLVAWKNMTYYTIAMYLPLEHLMHPNVGPGLVRDLARLFRSRNYVTVSDEDIPCVWYQSIGKEKLEFYNRFRYEFSGFTPGYTKEQLHTLSNGLEQLMHEMSDDESLVSILKRYNEAVHHATRLDHAWVNKTKSGLR